MSFSNLTVEKMTIKCVKRRLSTAIINSQNQFPPSVHTQYKLAPISMTA